jgi:hypothetical protein
MVMMDTAPYFAGAATLSMTTFIIMTLSIIRLFGTLGMNDTQHNDIQHNRYRVPSAIMQNVVMRSVVAPFCPTVCD